MKYEADKAEENGAYVDYAVEVTKKKRKVKGEVGKSGINYNFQHTGWYYEKSEDDQVYSPIQILEEESKRVHKIFRHRRVDWAALYPEVEYFQDGDIDMMELIPLLIVNVCNKMIGE